MANNMLRSLPVLLFLLLVTLAVGQIAPQFSVTNVTLGAVTSYKLSYYSNNSFSTATTFTVYFNQSYLKILDGANNCTIKVGGTVAVSPLCSCSNANRTCTFKPMVTSAPSTIEIQIQNVTNPLFLHQQTLVVFIYFTSTISYNFSSILSPNTYQPMSMIINKLTQSDYGVGYTPVNYVFNISLFYISKNMQLQITVPPQVTYNSISSSLSFYGTIQNVAPYQVQSVLVFPLQIQANSNPSGFFLLNLNGLGNPRYLGNSTSFKITFVQTTAVNQCANCKIAEITTGLSVQSRNPGDVLASSITGSNKYISALTTLSINLQLYAGIPPGGKVSLYLPPQIVPVLPIQCNTFYGYIITDNSPPTCTYNATYNRIDTVNFATPYFDSTGNGIMTIKVTNPQDSRQVVFKFQTYDNAGRMIGQSRSSCYYNALPLPLNISINKTSSQVDKNYNMSIQLTLSQSLATTGNYIQIILPPVNYNLSSILCISAGQDLNCTKTLSPIQQQLTLKFSPPCVQCTANSTLKFSILNLKNPSYINSDNEQIIVNTRSAQGIIENSQKGISLTPTSIDLVSYTKPTNQPIGFEYNLTISLRLPDYVRTNGGQVHVAFSNKSTYSDGQLSGFSYTGPSYALQIVTSNNSTTILSNSVQYDPDTVPDTITKIIFNICDGSTSICSSPLTQNDVFTFIIRRLKLSYIPSQQTTDTLRISTKFGEIIGEKVMDTSSYAPIMNMGNLSMAVTRSITNSVSDFSFGFVSQQVVIDQTINFVLPSSLIINGQCSITSNQGFITNFVCTKTSNNSVSISINCDQNLMISQIISYTILITSVTTPPSTIPLNYILETTYNGVKNQRFSNRYAMQAPCPLNLTYSKTNYTINQQFKLSISIVPVTLLYDSYELIFAKNAVITQSDWQPLFNFTENQTHYSFSRLGTMPNNYTEIRAKNSLSTYEQPQYTVNLLQSGYLVQQTMISPPNNDPVILGCNVTLTNRTVNMMTNMTISCDRNSNGQLNDKQILIKLPTSGFDYSSATYSTPISPSSPSITLNINESSPRVVSAAIQSLKNLRYLPNLSVTAYSSNLLPSIEVVSVQDTPTKIVGRTIVQSKFYAPIDAYDIKGTNATRASTKSGQITNITIEYASLLGTLQHALSIKLPDGQNLFNGSGCKIGPNLDDCNVINWNSTDMIISYRPNATIYLTKVQNNYPNSNPLSIKLLTYPQMQAVQQSLTSVLPPIALQKLQLTGRFTSAKVADVSLLTLQIKPLTLKIQASNIIKIGLPNSMFTRAFNNDDCIVKSTMGTNNYTGCTFQLDTNGWITTLKLGSFGPFDVDINATITVTFSVTNAWTTYPFINKQLTVTIYKTQLSASSQGVLALTDLYQSLPSFTNVPISQNMSSFGQSSLTAGAANNLTINLMALGNIGRGTKLIIMIPKDAFIFINSSALTLYKEDPSYFYVSTNTSCLAAGCQNYFQNFFIGIKNNYYIKKQRNNLMIFLQYDGLPSSDTFVVVVDYHTPLPLPSLFVNRTSSVGSQKSTISLTFSLIVAIPQTVQPTTFAFGQVFIDISNNITSTKYQSTFKYLQQPLGTNNTNQSSITQQVTGTVFDKNSQNITVTVPASSSNATVLNQILIYGKNSIQIPISSEQYWIFVQNTTHILYSSTRVAFPNKLVPLSQGLALIRSNTTVSSLSQLSLVGTIPQQQMIAIGQYPITINNQTYSTNSFTISVALPAYQNPPTLVTQPSMSVSMCNRSHCIYRQNTSTIVPALTPIQFTVSDARITMPSNMTINTAYAILVNFTNQQYNKTFIQLTIDSRIVNGSIGNVTGYCINDTTNKIDKVSNLSLNVTTLTDASSSIVYRTLTIFVNGTSRIFNITSLQLPFSSPAYQLVLPSSPVKVYMQPPSTTFQNIFNFSVSGTAIAANISCTSNRINEIANYTINLQPILRNGVISVQFPMYISALFTNGNTTFDDTMHHHLNLSVDGNYIAINGTRSQIVGAGLVDGFYLLDYNYTTGTYRLNIMLQYGSVPTKKHVKLQLFTINNPPDNRPLLFRIVQHQLEPVPTKIYGYAELTYKMSLLNPIHVYSGIRNITKIGAPIQLNLDIETLSGPADWMTIKLSQTQVLVNGDLSCTVCIDGTDCTISIEPIKGQNSLKLYPHKAGRHMYTVSSCLSNSLFSQQPLPGDEIHISLTLPYQTAESTAQTSTYITPLISTGSIELLSIRSTSNRRVDYTTLTLELKPENWGNCDGIFLAFGQLAYIVHKNIAVQINGNKELWAKINDTAMFVQISNKSAVLNLRIINIINYIQNSGIVVSTLKKKLANSSASSPTNIKLTSQPIVYNPSEYGVADQLNITSAVNTFTAYSAQTRIIFPDNYLSSQPKKIMAINDYNLPSELSTSSFKYSFSSTQAGCSKDLQYNKTVTMECTMSASGQSTFSLTLFDLKSPSNALTSFSQQIYIYPSPKDHCSNVMCDVCSTTPDGSEFCFSCRQGLYSSNGQCVNNCPTQTFPYNDMTCTSCSPQCQTCFDLYDNSCLSCRDISLLLDSGNCRTYCSQGFAYQAKYCIDNQQCSKSNGCRLCSPTGFCYQCLPEFKGQPNCKYSQILPKNFFIFWMIPFVLLIPIVGLITCIKVGKNTLSHMLIFLFSVVQLMSWVLVIPKLPEQALAMVMCAFLILKIIVSIVAYETYYNKQITTAKQQRLLDNEQSQQKTDHLQANSKKSKDAVKSEQQPQGQKITHKERFSRFMAHFLCCDAYELLLNKLGKPYISHLQHYTPFLVISIINRAIVMVFLIFVMVKGATGDLLFVPIIALFSGLAVIFIRIINSEKAVACLAKIKG